MKADGRERDEEKKVTVGMMGNLRGNSSCFIFSEIGLKD